MKARVGNTLSRPYTRSLGRTLRSRGGHTHDRNRLLIADRISSCADVLSLNEIVLRLTDRWRCLLMSDNPAGGSVRVGWSGWVVGLGGVVGRLIGQQQISRAVTSRQDGCRCTCNWWRCESEVLEEGRGLPAWTSLPGGSSSKGEKKAVIVLYQRFATCVLRHQRGELGVGGE